jgi:nanoRNase/pAp phosphatase (c-di-AMP/oligoRNAs hydrolase)
MYDTFVVRKIDGEEKEFLISVEIDDEGLVTSKESLPFVLTLEEIENIEVAFSEEKKDRYSAQFEDDCERQKELDAEDDL